MNIVPTLGSGLLRVAAASLVASLAVVVGGGSCD
jgi:hypothetical protein